jgi:hypothetical protein
LARKSEGKRLLVRPRRGWALNIKVGIKETGCEEVDWIHLAEGRGQWWVLVNMIMNHDFHTRREIS